jgi:hypothetical protein
MENPITSATPPGNSRAGLIATVVDRILTYVDRPWRALFIVTILAIGGIGFAIHERPDILNLLGLSAQAPMHLGSDRALEAAIRELLDGTGLDAIAVLAVDLGPNVATVRRGLRRDGTPWKVTPAVMEWVYPQANAALLTKNLHGEPGCFDPRDLHSGLAQFLVRDGIGYACYVPVPPSSTEQLLGIVVLGWKTDPGEPLVRSALAAVRQATGRLIGH